MVTYLAVTTAELPCAGADKLSYMACHFSLYGTGLSNLPQALPTGSMLILNDQIPISGHDPHRIADQLNKAIETLKCDSLLLDLQRPGNRETERLCQVLAGQIPCPMGISHHYAGSLDCAVFLPPPPLDRTLAAHLKPWQGRRLWLEAALDAEEFTVTPGGCSRSPIPYEPRPGKNFTEQALHCRYRCDVASDQIRFSLYRTADQLEALLQEAGALGIEKAIGLYQQLHGVPI